MITIDYAKLATEIANRIQEPNFKATISEDPQARFVLAALAANSLQERANVAESVIDGMAQAMSDILSELEQLQDYDVSMVVESIRSIIRPFEKYLIDAEDKIYPPNDPISMPHDGAPDAWGD